MKKKELQIYLRFRIRDRTEISRLRHNNLGCFPSDGADTQLHVSQKHLVTVHLEELRGRIFSSHLQQDMGTTRMGVGELGQVIDFGVNHHVERVGGVVCGDLITGEECCG